MSMSLIKKAELPTSGTLTAGSPGPFDSVSGTLYCGPFGPSGSGIADPRGAKGFGRLSFGSTTKAYIGFWLNIKSQQESGTNVQTLINTDTGLALVSRQTSLVAYSIYVSEQVLNITTQNHRWLYIALACRQRSGSNFDVRAYYKHLGGPLTSFWSIDNNNIFATPSVADFGLSSDIPPNPVVHYAFGQPHIYSFENDDFSDVVYPAAISEPAETRTYYINTGSGSDSNDGSSPASAWQTGQKLHDLSTNSGILSGIDSARGSTVIIDTTAAPIDISGIVSDGVGLKLETAGINIRGVNNTVDIKAHKVIATNEWSVVGSGVYSTTNTSVGSVVWEDDKWMTHPNGANYAAVSASLAATPGSFWTDGTTLYVHPFGSTDPRADGKSYHRSVHTGAAVLISGNGCDIRDLVINKTCDVDTAGTSSGGYCITSGSGLSDSTVRLKNCKGYYGGKHIIGLVADDDNATILIEDCVAEQGSPYSSQSPWVSYMGGAAKTGNIHRYIRCVTEKNVGVFGSTAGGDSNAAVWLCHNNGEGAQFDELSITDCSFVRGTVSTGLVSEFHIVGSRIGGVTNYSPTCYIERCWIDWLGIGNSASPGLVYVRNNIIAPECSWSSGLFEGWRINQTFIIEGNTFDYSLIPNPENSGAILFPSASVDITFRNNIVFGDTAILREGTASDTLVFDRNAYLLDVPNEIALWYNGGGILNLQQWQALGKDINTITPADLMLTDAYIPTAGSPVIDAGSDRGPSVDYTGVLFVVRNDIGAYEYFYTDSNYIPNIADSARKLLWKAANLARILAGNTNVISEGYHNLDLLQDFDGSIAQYRAGVSGVAKRYDALLGNIAMNIYGDLPVSMSTPRKWYYIAVGLAGLAGVSPNNNLYPTPGDRLQLLMFKVASFLQMLAS